MPETAIPSNRALLIPFVLPYAIYTGIASLPPGWLSPEASYLARLVGSGLALVWAWHHYPPLVGPRGANGSILLGVLIGIVGTIVWVLLVAPFAPDGASALSTRAVLLRLAATTTLVPLFEELLMRGYLLRIVVQWERARAVGATDPFGVAFDRSSIHDVEPGAWTPAAVAVSTLLFTLGHGIVEWPAAIVYGLGMAALWIWRRDLLSCVIAHAVTNLSLGLYVVATGTWEAW
jgi:membrane protease YdiL (CAAX protease family)